jgi:uncharacterized membrane protein
VKFDDRDDVVLDAALRELGDEARVTHRRSDLDAVYASVVASLDAQKKTRKPGRVTVRAGECDGGVLVDEPVEETACADSRAERWNTWRTVVSWVTYVFAFALVAVAGVALARRSHAETVAIMTAVLALLKSTHLVTSMHDRERRRHKVERGKPEK